MKTIIISFLFGIFTVGAVFAISIRDTVVYYAPGSDIATNCNPGISLCLIGVGSHVVYPYPFSSGRQTPYNMIILTNLDKRRP